LVLVLRCVSVLLLSARSESSQMASFLGFPRVGNLTLYVTLYDCLFLKPRVLYDDIRLLIEKHDHSLTSKALLLASNQNQIVRIGVYHRTRQHGFGTQPSACPNLISLVYSDTFIRVNYPL